MEEKVNFILLEHKSTDHCFACRESTAKPNLEIASSVLFIESAVFSPSFENFLTFLITNHEKQIEDIFVLFFFVIHLFGVFVWVLGFCFLLFIALSTTIFILFSRIRNRERRPTFWGFSKWHIIHVVVSLTVHFCPKRKKITIYKHILSPNKV